MQKLQLLQDSRQLAMITIYILLLPVITLSSNNRKNKYKMETIIYTTSKREASNYEVDKM